MYKEKNIADFFDRIIKGIGYSKVKVIIQGMENESCSKFQQK